MYWLHRISININLYIDILDIIDNFIEVYT